MATQVAARTVALPKVLPPASPFSELLRRSKFASFDPEIRQSYSAPPSYIHRGNWGLKRPLANRKRHGYIVLKKFEEHAHYIEWDNAEEQVRFLKRLEEVNLAPKLQSNTPWYQGLGPLATAKASGLDSEFCPGEQSFVPRARNEIASEQVNVAGPDAPKHPPNLVPIDLPAPTQGKGGYGAKFTPMPEDQGQTFLQPNISSMPPKVFKRYLQKLREMRPEFVAWLRQELKKSHIQNRGAAGTINPDDYSDEQLVSTFSGNFLSAEHHIRFLGQKSDADYHAKPTPEALTEREVAKKRTDALAAANTPQPIRPQPHKLAGLMYSQPTALESYFTMKAEPGLYLQSNATAHNHRYEKEDPYIAAFAGLTGKLVSVSPGSVPLFDHQSGADPHNIPASERKMLMTKLFLEKTPVVVGRTATSQPLHQVYVKPTIVDESAVDQNWRDNPHRPGSYEYSTLKATATRKESMASSALRNAANAAAYGSGRRFYEGKPGFSKGPAVFRTQLSDLDKKSHNAQDSARESTLQLLANMTHKSWGIRGKTPKSKLDVPTRERDGDSKSS